MEYNEIDETSISGRIPPSEGAAYVDAIVVMVGVYSNVAIEGLGSSCIKVNLLFTRRLFKNEREWRTGVLSGIVKWFSVAVSYAAC